MDIHTICGMNFIWSLKYFRDGSEGLEDIAINNRKGDKSLQLFNMPKGCFQAIAFLVFSQV